MAKPLLFNTKQTINWDHNNPLSGYGAYGILEEATNVMIHRGHGVGDIICLGKRITKLNPLFYFGMCLVQVLMI
ncbi:MAG: hypothetical protein VB126_09355 [Paludibacter sp.]|nr:hypothetical protein [Paludibacter sp.]